MDPPLWLLLALFGAATTAFSSFVDKIEVSKIFKSPWALFVWWGVYWLVASSALYVFLPKPVEINLFAIAAGIALAVGSPLYFKAINAEDVSRVAPIFFVSPFFTLLISVLFLGVGLGARDYAGILILVAGAVLMGVREPGKLALGKGARYALANAAVSGVGAVLTKLAVGSGNQLEVFFWIYFTYAIGNLIYSRPYFREFSDTFSKISLPLFAFLLLMVFDIIVSDVAFIYAYSLQSAPLVSAIAASVPLFIFIFALLASLFAPDILKEEVDARTAVFKAVGAVMIILGVFLVS